MSIIDIDKPTKALRTMAKAIAMGDCPEQDAFEFLEQAYRLGVINGKKQSYLAQRRATEARKESKHG